MHRMGMVLAACLLAACGTGERDDARPAAPQAGVAADSAAPADAGPAAAESAPGEEPYAFLMHETRSGVVDSIIVSRADTLIQWLVPPENHVPPEAGVVRISRIDLDFDGHPDLGFVTELTMAGSHSAYWRLDPAARRFRSAGVYETLQVDSAARELTSFTRGGHAGRLWTASRFRWMDGALVEVRREEQDTAEDGEGYVRIVRERRGGALAEVSRDKLTDATLDAGPSWGRP